MYAELRRLERLGYLSAVPTRARTRPRTTYHLTDTGRAVISEWIGHPSQYPRIQHEAGVRVAAADLGDDHALLKSLAALRAQLPDLERLIGEVEQRAEMYPHRGRYLRLEMSLGRRLIQAHRDWISEVEQTLGDDPHGGATGR
jgi:DNA-binding PadR family transcriptional regulator